MLLPFAHAAVTQADVSPAWCVTGEKAPSMSANPASEQDDQAGKMMFCPVCAAASWHAIAPLSTASVLLASPSYSSIDLPALSISFSSQSYAIPPPPRGPPLNS
nr:hypothetical protein [Deefgea rivuli]